MLLAYIDEIGSPGAFISPSHAKFSDSPAFGYAGFVIPEESARWFGAKFTDKKRTLFASELKEAKDPARWEKKGANLLFAKVAEERPQNLRVLASLIKTIKESNGHLFYYAEEKPVGTPKQTNTGPTEFAERESTAMRETLNRLARHADYHGQHILVMMDQINENSRKKRLPEMYSHIFGRGSDHLDMRRITEPPMHIDSQLSSNIQFADWIAALAKRAIEYQLVEDSRYHWIPDSTPAKVSFGNFTYESKLRLCSRSIQDLNHSDIISQFRPMFDGRSGNTMSPENKRKLEQVRAATLREQETL